MRWRFLTAILIVLTGGSAVGGELEVVPTATKEVIDRTGDGVHPLWSPQAIEYDPFGNLYVAGTGSNNVFRIGVDGSIRQIIGPDGDGVNNLEYPFALDSDSFGNVFVAGYGSHNVFRISPSGRIDQILGPEGDGNSPLEYPFCLVTGPDGMVYAGGLLSNNVFAISPDGDVREVIDESGDGKTNFYNPTSMLIDSENRLVAAAGGTLFRLDADPGVTTLFDAGPDDHLGLQWRIRSGKGGSYLSLSDIDFFMGNVRLLRIRSDRSLETILDVGKTYDQPNLTPSGLGSYVVATDFLRRPEGSILIAAHKLHYQFSPAPPGRPFFTGTVLEVLPNGTVTKLIEDDGSVPRREPYALALAPDGRVAVADARNGSVVLLGTQTTYPVTSGSSAATAVLILLVLVSTLWMLGRRQDEG